MVPLLLHTLLSVSIIGKSAGTVFGKDVGKDGNACSGSSVIVTSRGAVVGCAGVVVG